jgi:hypothetical protein
MTEALFRFEISGELLATLQPHARGTQWLSLNGADRSHKTDGNPYNIFVHIILLRLEVVVCAARSTAKQHDELAPSHVASFLKLALDVTTLLG